MVNAVGQQLALGLLLLIIGFGAGVFFWLTRQLAIERERTMVLRASMSTVFVVCYRLNDGRAIRVDGEANDPVWPLELATLLEFVPDETRHGVELRLRSLAAAGTSFTQRIVVPGKLRTLELTGQRLTATSRPSLDFILGADVTERESQASARIRIERDLGFLRNLLDRLPLAIWWRSDELATVNGNRKFASIPALETLTRPLAEAAKQSGLSQRSQQELQVDGTLQTLELFEFANDSGGSIGYALDRTEAVNLRGELDRLSLVHRQVLEGVGSAVAIWGADTRLLFYNAAFERLWGLDHDWLESEPTLSEVLDALRDMRSLPEYADFRQFKAEQMALFTALDEQRDELLHLPDERTVRQTITRHPFGGLTFAYEDVTDRLALERSFNTLTAVQRETLDNLHEGIAVFGSDGRLKLYNPAYGTMWRFEQHDLASRPHISSLLEKTRPLYLGEDWDGYKRAGIDKITAYRTASEQLVLLNGMVVQVNAVPLPDGNMLLSYRDVSDTVQVQRALQEKNDALEAATRLKSEFIAHVTFELRTPLNAIIGFAEILTNQYFGPLNERQIDYSRGILDSSQRLMALVNDILDLTTLEAGQLILQTEPIDIHTLLANVLAAMRERAQQLELTLNFDCPTGIGVVMADEKRLRQALFNLMSNAIKFTPANGSVSLTARRVKSEVGISVTDTGIGIEAEQLKRVFEKFERGQSGTRSTGAGLGLSLVKSFIELHGGRVEIESVPQQGTTVTCWLPAGRRPLPPRPVGRRRTDPRPASPPMPLPVAELPPEP
jgi:signal transduction histidine kinase